MTNALFVGWGPAVRGREQQSLQVFGEGIQFWETLVQQGRIESYRTVQLEPHGGDLAGFLIAWGTPEQIAQIHTDEAFHRINARAQLVVENFGVVGASTGAELQQLFQMFGEIAQELVP